jgi:lipopolysaccharide/colanic/teichoic acid biosynthesis glycosyltransferase
MATAYQLGMKRVFDVTVAALLLVLFSPLACGLAVLIRITLGSPVLFRQTRPGLNGRPFELWKFRTMSDLRDADGALLPDAARLGGFGRFLRRTSLDELPELANVVRGEMSLVGPRPLLMSYLARYTTRQARRHEVRPGITGLAQISGRNLLSWEDRFECDVWYIDHWSIWLDLKILFKTVATVIAREGISQPGRETADEFMGPASPRRVEPRS